MLALNVVCLLHCMVFSIALHGLRSGLILGAAPPDVDISASSPPNTHRRICWRSLIWISLLHISQGFLLSGGEMQRFFLSFYSSASDEASSPLLNSCSLRQLSSLYFCIFQMASLVFFINQCTLKEKKNYFVSIFMTIYGIIIKFSFSRAGVSPLIFIPTSGY